MPSIRTLISLAGVPSLVLCSDPQVGKKCAFHSLPLQRLLENEQCAQGLFGTECF